MKRTVIFLPVLFFIVALCLNGMAQTSTSFLSLQSYLAQVKNQNGTIKANELAATAFKLRMEEGGLDFMPYLIGNASYTDNQQVTPASVFNGTETITEAAGLGFQEKLRTGTQVALTYNYTMTQVYGSAFIPPSAYPFYVASPLLSITQPLWKDFNASLSKANEEATASGLKAQSLSSHYSSQQVLYNAETAYWRLALNREIVRLDKESIERTSKILKWNQRRVSMNVTDKSDLLQSEASLKSKELTYLGDVEALRQASLQFNSLRNVKNDSVADELQPIENFLNLEIKEFKRTGERADVQIAKANNDNLRAQAQALEVKLQPDVQLFGSVQPNGHGSTPGAAVGSSWNKDDPIYTVGLKLSIPLDFGTVGSLNQAYAAQKASAEAAINKAQFDLDQDWVDLQKHYHDALSRLQLAKELEELQGHKLQYERSRFQTGRSTSFQVLQFEDNYSDALLSKLRIENELVTMRAQARLYNGESL